MMLYFAFRNWSARLKLVRVCVKLKTGNRVKRVNRSSDITLQNKTGNEIQQDNHRLLIVFLNNH